MTSDRDLLDEPGELRRDAGGELVPMSFGERRIPGEVDEADRGRSRNARVQARDVECDLGMVRGMLDPDVLAVSSVDRHDRGFQRGDDALPDVGAELHEAVLVHAGTPESSLDLGLVQLGLGLRKAAEGVRIHAEQAERARLARAEARERPNGVDHLRVVPTSPISRGRRREPHGLVQGAHEGHRDVLVGAELAVGPVGGARPGHHRRVEEIERELARLEGAHDEVRAEPGPLP